MPTKLSISFVFVALLLGQPNTYGQTSVSPTANNNLYSQALIAAIKKMDKEWGSINDGDATQMRTDYHHMIVLADPGITDGLPTDFDGYHVQYLDSTALIAKYKQLRKNFSVLEIRPIQNHDATLVIEIPLSYVSSRHRNINFAYSDWADVSFDYDCQLKMFVISDIKLGGI